MGAQTPYDLLNRLLVMHARSLPVYLTYAPPWWQDRDGRIADVLGDIARDQLELADRIGALLVAQGGTPAVSQFPPRFLAFHDLGVDFLLREMIGYEDRMIAAIERVIPQLARWATAQALAQEAAGMAKAHRDILGELQRELVGAAS